MTVILLAVAVLALLVIAVAIVSGVLFVVKKGMLNPGSAVPMECCEAKEAPGTDIVLAKLDGLSDQLGRIMELLVQILEEEQKGNAWIEQAAGKEREEPPERQGRKNQVARRAPRKRKPLVEGTPAGEG